jgi:hypothetical protein
MVPMTSSRRGVLLLVVLSVLTLFLMLGAAYVAVASRARKASRAFADNVVANAAAGAGQQHLLDEAFMAVARGTTVSGTAGVQIPFVGNGANGGDDLLGDKYGASTITGRVSAAIDESGSKAVLRLTCTATANVPANSAEYAGRVATLCLPGLTASTRILTGTGPAASPTLFIAGGPTVTGEVLSAARLSAAIARVTPASTTTLVINGREFDDSSTNEPYDGYDDKNPLLAKSGTDVISSGTAFMYRALGRPLTIDNDGDGVADSGFVDLGLPPVVDAKGNVLQPEVAVLVLDLDGRLNVNAHGSATDAQTAGRYPTLNGPTVSATTVPLYQLPRGLAGGPAEVSLSRSLLFSNTNTTTEATVVQDATYSLAGRTINGSTGADTVTGRETPKIDGAEGRFGDRVTTGTISAVVGTGVANHNDQVSRPGDAWRATAGVSGSSRNFFDVPGRFGTPWDVKQRMRVWVDDFGQPVYYKPDWSTAGTADDDVVDDPYEVNLTRLGARAGYASTPAGVVPTDNLYTPAELEGLLRYHDPDSMKLARRLVAISERHAARNRRLVTTESWDTPAIVGKAWRDVVATPFAGFLAAGGPTPRPQDVLSPETLMGHKFDINRPFHDTDPAEPNDTTGTARRKAFARQLYCLMVAIAVKNGVTMNADVAKQIAQYAVNVVDYRDGDSVMTRFEYDPAFRPNNAVWSPGADDYVWGCERPELLLTETLAWHDRRTDDESVGNKVVDTSNADEDFDQSRRPWGAFFVELYCPWRGRTATRTVSGTTVLRSGSDSRADPIPASLRQSGTHGVALANGAGVAEATLTLNKTVGGFPVWRLAAVRGDSTGINATTKNIVDPSAAGATAAVDRVFYFGDLTGSGTAMKNPANAKDGKPGAVFWTTGSAAVEPSQSNYVVVGTAGLGFQYDRTAATSPPAGGLDLDDVVHLPFNQPSQAAGARLPATLSERVSTTPATASSQDPYELLAEAQYGGNQNKFVPDDSAAPKFYSPTRSLQHPVDQPLDMATGVPDISPPILTTGGALPANQPLLMFNGTHENFAVLHLQRLANPGQPWNATTNPYVTVDSMPVDLTVFNTATNGNNYDESGATGTAPLSWLTTQKTYRYQSIERGGKDSSPPAIQRERDIWSRRVTTSGTALASGTTAVNGPSPYLTGTISPRPAKQLVNNPPNPPQLDTAPKPILTGSTDHTLRELVAQTATDSRPARFEKGANLPPRFPWLAWPNQPFSSAMDLALVPVASPFDLPGRHSTNSAGSPSPKFFHLPRFFEATTPENPWKALAGRTANNDPSLFDFVHVPSSFTAMYTTITPITSNTTALQSIGLDIFPLNQVSNFREPGRININTISDRSVWRGLFGAVNAKGVAADPLNPDDPVALPVGEADLRDRLPGWSPTVFARVSSGTTAQVNDDDTTPDDGQSPSRVKTLASFFNVMPNPGEANRRVPSANAFGFIDDFRDEDTNGNGSLDAGEDFNNNGQLDYNRYRDTNLHAYFRYQTMRRLSSVVTTRSNVYAVWITIRYVDSNGNEVTPIRRNRAFYIFDRSIPVAYEKGKDHNVRDAILLRRIIE